MSQETELNARRKDLEKMIGKASRELKKAPDGTLRISHTKSQIQYYHRELPSDRNGKYISKKDTRLIRALAQKDYDEKVIALARQEQRAIDAYQKYCPKMKAEELYENLSESRRQLVIPILETEEIFRKNWESKEYQGKGFDGDGSEYVTDKEERVRSKSEVLIANMLAKADVPYRYECPLFLKGFGTVYPDFTVLNLRLRKELYWEHFGMMDDTDYVEKAVRKLATYMANGIYPGENLIMTFESGLVPLNLTQVRDLVKHYFL